MCRAPAASAHVLGMRLDRQTGTSPRKARGIAVSVLRCRECGLHFASPQPKPGALSDHYGIPPETYWKGQSFREDPNYFRRQIEVASELVGQGQTPIRALDIGVGLGKAVVAMRRAGMDVWGIEPSEPFHARALETTGLDSERLQCVSLEDAEFPEGSFDFITFGAVLEHLYDPAGAIERSVQWLRPGGIWHAEIPSSDHLIGKIINWFFRSKGTSFVTNLSPMHSPFHIYEFTLESFRKHAERATGFEIANSYYDVCNIDHVPKALHPLFRWQMRRANSGMQLTVWLRRTT
jgi:SAM-dependent methyltransferase